MRGATILRTILYGAISALLMAGGASAESLSQYLDVESPHGEITARYLDYAWYARQNHSDSRMHYGLLEEEVYLGTKIAVYDPRFVEISLGGGTAIGQGYGDHDGGNNSLDKLNLNVDILKQHLYSGNLHWNRQEIDFQQSPTATYLLNQDEYGAGLSLKEGVLPWSLPLKFTFDTLRRDNKNSFAASDLTDDRMGFYAFNETTSTTEVTSQKRWQDGTDLYLRLTNISAARFYENRDQRADIGYESNGAYLSASGGLGEKIGEKNIWRWRTLFNMQDQNAQPKFSVFDTDDELRYMLFDNSTQALDSVVNVGVTDGSREASTSSGASLSEHYGSTRFNGGFDHRLFQSLFSEAKFRFNELTAPDVTDTRQELLLGTRYTKQIENGNITANYSVIGSRELNTGAQSASVFNDFYVVSDYNVVTFNADNIVASSIVVTDQSGKIIFLEGIDYRVYQIGHKTYLERLPGSSMLNGGTILVNYTKLNYGGTLNGLDQDVMLSIRWRAFEPYLHVHDVRQELAEGNSLLLNPGRSTIYGLKINHTFLEWLTIDLGAEEEENSYLADPFHRSQIRGALSFEILYGLNFGVYSSHAYSDFYREGHDMLDDTLGANLNLNWGRLGATLGVSREQHAIGVATREIDALTASTIYKYGRWTLASTFRFANEEMENKDGAADYRFYDIANQMFRISLSRKF